MAEKTRLYIARSGLKLTLIVLIDPPDQSKEQEAVTVLKGFLGACLREDSPIEHDTKTTVKRVDHVVYLYADPKKAPAEALQNALKGPPKARRGTKKA